MKIDVTEVADDEAAKGADAPTRDSVKWVSP